MEWEFATAVHSLFGIMLKCISSIWSTDINYLSGPVLLRQRFSGKGTAEKMQPRGEWVCQWSLCQMPFTNLVALF